MRPHGIRWSVFALACAGLTACGGGSSGGGDGGDPFETGTEDFSLEGDDTAANLANVQTALAAGLAVVATANQAATLGIDDIVRQFATLDPTTIERDCEGGSGAVVISEPPGLEKRMVFTTDQCYDAQDDQVSDGQFSLDVTEVDADFTGTLDLGGDLAPFAVAQRSGSVVDFTQISGSAIFDGDNDGVPFAMDLTDFRVIQGDGNEPSGDALFTPDRWLETLAGAASVGSLELEVVSASSSGVLVSVNGPMVAAGQNTSAACANIGRFTVQTTDLAIDNIGNARGGTLTLNGGAATIEFAENGDANVTVVGDDQAFTAAEVAAFCGL